MIKYEVLNKDITEGTLEINYSEAHKIFMSLYKNYKYKFLLESKDVSQIYGRLSLIGVDPVLKITGKNDTFYIECLNPRGERFYKKLPRSEISKLTQKFEITNGKMRGEVVKVENSIEERNRSKQQNISQIIRIILKTFKLDKKALIGLYGAFSYDFVRLFEDIGDKLPENKINDFTLFIYDTFVFFDHLKNRTEIILYRHSKNEIQKDAEKIIAKINAKNKKLATSYKITKPNFSLNENQYKNLVRIARNYAKKGELCEVVFSNILKADFKGDPFGLYLKYREENPSPYLFYMDFCDEQLVGASPEMMVRYENGRVNLRPISGTIKRGNNPIEDHENMLKLLSDPKERAELDMLIDLGRNDLSRICNHGVTISDYRFVEKYSKVMHTVAHLSGKLNKKYTALDVLISCANAGTLTGAPKVAAMKVIENHETERRGYYGGTVGYFTFYGEMDTGIIIRTAHIRDGKLRFQVGATLLYDSKPAKEYHETLNKAKAFLNTFANNI